VHAVSKNKSTALHLAVQFQAGPEVFGLLLAAGAENKHNDGDPILTPEQEAEALAAVATNLNRTSVDARAYFGGL
jgi:hypothetical protein